MNSLEKAFKIVAEKHNIKESLVEQIYKSFFKQLRHEISVHPYVKIHLTNFGSFIPNLGSVRHRILKCVRLIREGKFVEEYTKELRFLWKTRYLITTNTKIKPKKRYDGRKQL